MRETSKSQNKIKTFQKLKILRENKDETLVLKEKNKMKTNQKKKHKSTWKFPTVNLV